MQAYVVEDPVTGDITDVAGFRLDQTVDDGHRWEANITILVAAKSPARQLLIDLLVMCAKQAKVDAVNTLKFGLTNDVFEHLFSIKSQTYHCYLLNYHYYEVDESQVCLFCGN